MELPFVVIALSYVFGIIVGKSFPFSALTAFFSIIIFLAICSYAYIKKINLSHILLVVVFLTGILAVKIISPPMPQYMANIIDKKDTVSRLSDDFKQRFNQTLLHIL